MEQTQLEHLKEAAQDIRASIIGSLDIVVDLMNQDMAIGSNMLQYESLSKKIKNAERALTRIEMALREIK